MPNGPMAPSLPSGRVNARLSRRVGKEEGEAEEETLLQFRFRGICSLLYSVDFYMDS